MTWTPITKAEAEEAGLTPVEYAADVFAAKTANWLINKLEKTQNDDGESPFNHGGGMIFDPEHLGSGFTGEFEMDDWVIPLWLDGEVGQPSVWTAMEKAFIAGAKWQAKRGNK